jgi:hypothetical protein
MLAIQAVYTSTVWSHERYHLVSVKNEFYGRALFVYDAVFVSF